MGNESNKKDYEVGYGKPPEHTRFKKGQPGNGGRPKGAKSFKTLLEEELNQEITIIVRGKPRRITLKRALVRRAVQRAVAQDDLRNLRELGAFDELTPVIEANYPRTFTLKLEDDTPHPNDRSDDDDFDYSQPQSKPGGSTAPE